MTIKMFSMAAILLFLIVPFAYSSETGLLTLEEAIQTAVKQDPWLKGSQHREDAMLFSSKASSTLADPVVTIGIANLPTNGFAFDQEPMTQLKAGVSQMFPRGDSLRIRSKQLAELAHQHPFMRLDRAAKTRLAVSFKWLDVFRAKQTIALIQQDRMLFEQLGEVAQTSYASAIGNVRQQDIFRAQLELSRLDDRLTQLLSQKEQAKAELLEWLTNTQQWSLQKSLISPSLEIPAFAPTIIALHSPAKDELEARDMHRLATLLKNHPSILAIDQEIAASKTGIDLAKQQYKPQWGLNASYAYRADDQMDRSRADFISLGISFDVPFFSTNKQDNQVSAAISESEALKTEKIIAIRALLSQLQSAYAAHQRLLERRALYNTDILVQIRNQAEASLTAYTNDDGDFAEVVRARIADLNTRIDALNIEVDILKSQSKLNYFFNDLTVSPNDNLEITNE